MMVLKHTVDTYKNLSIQVKSSVWFVICSILQKGISLITVPIFTRMMTTEQYGYFSTYVSWYNILLVFTSLSLYYGVFNNAMMKYKDDRPRYISSMQGLVAVLTASVFVVYLCFKEPANRFLKMTTPMVLLLFVELLVTPVLHFWTAHNRFDFKYKKVVALTLCKSAANPILGIILVKLSEDKTIARITSIVLTEVCFCGIIAIIQFIRGKSFFHKEYWKYALLFNLPLIPHYLSGQILNQSDRIMIGHLVDQTAVAKYSVAYNIGLLMNIFTNAINGSYTPWFYQQFKKNAVNDIRRISTTIIMMMAAVVMMLMFFGPELLMILAPSKYSDAVYVIPTVAASVFFTFMYNIFANFEFYFEQNLYVLFGSVTAAIINIILNFIFIKLFGYIAAAYTTLVCYIIYSALHYYFATRLCKKNNVDIRVINTKIILLLSVVVVSMSIIVNIMYMYTIVRYALIISILSVILLNHRKFKRLVFNIFEIMKSQKR